MNFVIKWALKTVVGRWVTVSLIALLLGGGVWKWYDFKEDLRDEGLTECVQEINQATVDALEAALAEEQRVAAALRATVAAAATVNQEAVARKNESESRLAELERQMEAQRNVDPNYKDWSAAPLPDGVAARLREAARSTTGSTD